MTSRGRWGTLCAMRNLAIALLAVVLASCSSQSPTPRDPVAIGRTLGTLVCTGAILKEPGSKAPLAEALPIIQSALESDSPTQTGVDLAVAKIKDEKTRIVVSGVVASVLAIFPNLPANANAKLPDNVKEGLLAGIAGCGVVVGVTTTTTSTSSTTSTVPEPTTTSTVP